jgi:tRNA pseudouridine32 synthase / 23S rRNA pseudouridine746 synthase
MGISEYPSAVILPRAEQPYPSILGFLIQRFPDIHPHTWAERISKGKVLDAQGSPITLDTRYTPLKKIFYFREVSDEPVIPFTERILFQNDEILAACKPHFLPVIPGGRYINECLLHRLRTSTGNAHLVPMHRIDRETAGIVLFSVNPKTRPLYHGLFAQGKVEKTYHAIAEYLRHPQESEWLVENRIVRGEPRFRRRTTSGTANSRSHIHRLEIKGDKARFRLHPVTGKTHQLRIHMSGLGFRIINDRYYPDLQPQKDDDFDQPLQLIAKLVRFHDPVTGKAMVFRSERELLW